MRDLKLKPEYSSSHALVIGIDEFIHAPPLRHAVEDAKAVAKALQDLFAFYPDNVSVLLNAEATKERILSAFFRYEQATDNDSRLLFYYAGHGTSKATRHRDIGFLFPHNGDMANSAALISWDELTRGSDLIPAKHILFVTDACHGGLVFNRSLSAGSVRFLKDMIIRPVRQAISAGKEDEVVSDGGGPRPRHSMFTGHFLDALEGAARATEGHLTATGVMSYVYKQVANEIHAEQTPHYGFLSGDGDFVFDAPQLKSLAESNTSEQDSLVTISSLDIQQSDTTLTDPFSTTKQLISDEKLTISLHDFVVTNTCKVIVETSTAKFPMPNGGFDKEELTRRLISYEKATKDLRRILACIAYWGSKRHHLILSKTVTRLTDGLEPEGGLVIWTSLRWYPALLVCYSAGIAAVANEQYKNLNTLFSSHVNTGNYQPSGHKFVGAISNEILQMERCYLFKQIQGHEKYYTPRSEYLLKLLQPELDDDLFLGKSYEDAFDEFEILFALATATHRKRQKDNVWGPVGRFGWKSKSAIARSNMIVDVYQAIETQKTEWPPFKAGLFGSDFPFFMDVATEYRKMIGGLPWF